MNRLISYNIVLKISDTCLFSSSYCMLLLLPGICFSIFILSNIKRFYSVRVVAYSSRVLESAFTALDGLNKQAFLTELVYPFSYLL